MRPIKKPLPGETVRYENSRGETISHEVEKEYSPYGNAKFPLIGSIGRYCSYCERHSDVDALAVEHLIAKSKEGSETAWDNFLLSCTICNSVKGTMVPDTEYVWPHIDNTFQCFSYEDTGRIKVVSTIPEELQKKAHNLLNLLKMGRDCDSVDAPSACDFRWKRRYEAWNTAARRKEQYLAGKLSADDIIECAQNNGHWSVWFTVFTEIDEILKRMISDFPGTRRECFDAENHYKPI